MPAIVCPCCRATNETGPACRRCKCDLGLLFTAESRRDRLLQLARQAIGERSATMALGYLAEAEGLRRGPDTRRLVALAYLLRGQYAEALANHTAAQSLPQPAARA